VKRERPSVRSLIGLKDVRATLAMMRTSEGQGIERDKFHTPNAIRFGPVDAPVKTLGIRRVMFAVDYIDSVVARMRAHLARGSYANKLTLAGSRQPSIERSGLDKGHSISAYICGEGIIVALAEQLGLRQCLVAATRLHRY
jgi:hypothetical protein